MHLTYLCDDRPAKRWGSRVRDPVVLLINMLMHVLGACLQSAGGIGLLWLSQQHVLSVVHHFLCVRLHTWLQWLIVVHCLPNTEIEFQ